MQTALSTALLLALPFLAGFLFAIQAPINARLALYAGSAAGATMISFTVGFLTLASVMTVAALIGRPLLRTPSGAPVILFVGGLLGAMAVFAMAWSVPRVGITGAVAATITGQLVTAVVADHFGWFLERPIPIEPRRLVGVAVLAVGVWLARR